MGFPGLGDKTKNIVSVVAGVFFVVLLAANGGSSSKSNAAATVTAAPTAVATSAPASGLASESGSAASKPTAVTVAQSPAQYPSSPPPAAAASSSKTSVTPAEQAYIDTVVPKTVTLAASFERFSQLAGGPLNAITFAQMKNEAVLWEQAYQQWVSEPKAPASLADVDTHWGDGLRLINDSAVDLSQGIDALNPRLIQRASLQLNQGTSEIKLAAAALNTWKSARGL